MPRAGEGYAVLFLAIYLAFIAATFLVVRTYVWQTDASARLATPPVGASLDAFEIAFLRSGRAEALRTVLAGMHERGLLVVEDGTFAHTSVRDAAPAGNLEWAIYDATATPKTFAELARAVEATLETQVGACLERAHAEELLMPDGLRARARVLSILLSVILVGAGVALGTALASSLRIAPLFASIVGSFGILAIWIAGRVPRLSDRGRRYVAELTRGFPDAALRRKLGRSPARAERDEPAIAPLLVGLYGPSALRDTPLAAASRAMTARFS